MAMEESSTVIGLYISRGCCGRDSYAEAAHNHSLLFTLSDPRLFEGYHRVLRDAESVPLLYAKHKGVIRNRRIDVYRGDSSIGGELVFTVMEPSFFSSNLHIFLAGSSVTGPPDYKLKPATLRESMKIYRQEHVIVKVDEPWLVCGRNHPNYKITVLSDMDQATAVLLVAIYDDLRPKG